MISSSPFFSSMPQSPLLKNYLHRSLSWTNARTSDSRVGNPASPCRFGCKSSEANSDNLKHYIECNHLHKPLEIAIKEKTVIFHFDIFPSIRGILLVLLLSLREFRRPTFKKTWGFGLSRLCLTTKVTNYPLELFIGEVVC